MARWIRLDTTFDSSEWLFVLSPESQLAWVKMLCYVKEAGTAGRAKRLSHIVAAKRWSLGSESVEKLEQAAVTHGALKVVGDAWEIVKWDEYQTSDNTNAERQRRFKERKKVTEGNGVTTVSNRDLCHATETETETETVNPLSPPKSKARPSNVGEVLDYLRSIGCPNPDQESQKFLDHFIANGWVTGKAKHPVKDWQACARTWSGNAKKWQAPQASHGFRGAYD